MIAEVKPQEAALVDALGEIWNKYLELPVEHPRDQDEFCRGIHILQRQITSRAGRRAMREKARDKRETVLDALSALEQYQPPANLGFVTYSVDEYLWWRAVFRRAHNKNNALALINHDRVLTSDPRGQKQ